MRIAVLGVGTAGIVSLCHTLKWMCPEGSTVTSIYDPSVPVLGVGEASQPNFVKSLFEGANFDFITDAKEIDATIKFGATYIDWREHNFNMSIEPPNYGIHFNNLKLKAFCFKKFKQIWGNKFNVIEGKITNLVSLPSHAGVTVNNMLYQFDYVIDCRGTPLDLNDYNITDTTVNHCLVNIVDSPGNWNSTVNQATPNGWMFKIPLSTRQGWGYLYNDTLTTKEEAFDNFKSILTTDNLQIKEFVFKSYYAKQFFDGRVLKNGNRAFFFEPIEGLSSFFYDSILRYFIDYVQGNISIDSFNESLEKTAWDMENFVHFLYQGGSNFDSKFWNNQKEISGRHLRKKTNYQWRKVLLNVRKQLESPTMQMPVDATGRWSSALWAKWAEELDYDYFDNQLKL
jgi:hypothetical protein